MNFTTSLIPNVYNMTMKASDSYFTVLKSYKFETQNMITLNINTIPINTLTMIDNGSKNLINFTVYKINFNSISYLSIKPYY
jgi:hypothetical protein